MATAASLRARKDQIVQQYTDNVELVTQIQQQALEEVVAALRRDAETSTKDGDDNVRNLDDGNSQQTALEGEQLSATTALLKDKVTVFRFCRRARFSPPAALKLLHATCEWRLSSGLLHLTPASISSLYLTKPLFFFHPDLRDRFGRPCAVLNLRHVQRTPDGKLDALKEFARFGWEVARRYLSDLSRTAAHKAQDPTLQMVVIVDLDQAGMSNLEVELLPFFLDLLKNNFPGMVGAIFVLNYGWAYAGMWQLAKRVLPNTALERILFPSKEELLEFFDEENLLVEHGGKLRYEYSPENPILHKYGQCQLATNAAASPFGSRAPSRATSSSSLHHEVFHSAPGSGTGTPSLSRRSTGLVMTARDESEPVEEANASWFPFGRSKRARRSPRTPAPLSAVNGGDVTPSGLRRVRSLAELQQRLEQTQREIDSEDSIDESGSDGDRGDVRTERRAFGRKAEAGVAEDDTPIYSTGASIAPSASSSRYSSRVGSRAVSREGSPSRYRHGVEPLTAAKAAALQGKGGDLDILSPYNTSNPHFGYPAYLPPASLDPSGTPRSRFPRRRKRDLVRTLTYLAALRFLALHRSIQRRLNALIVLLFRLTGLGWWQEWRHRSAARSAGFASAADSRDGQDKKVHWTTSTAGSSPVVSSHESSSLSLSSIAPAPPGAHVPSHHLHHQHLSSALTHSSTSPPSPLIDIDPSVFYLTLLFLIVRTPDRVAKVKQLGYLLAVKMPTWSAAQARKVLLQLLIGKARAEAVLRTEQNM